MFFILCGVVAWNIGNVFNVQVSKNVTQANQSTTNSTTKNMTEKANVTTTKSLLGLIKNIEDGDISAPKHYDYQEIWWTKPIKSTTVTISTSSLPPTTKGTLLNIYYYRQTTYKKENSTKLVFKTMTYPIIINGTTRRRQTIRVKRPKNYTKVFIGRKEKSMSKYKNFTANSSLDNTASTDKLNYYYIVNKDDINGTFKLSFNKTGLSVDDIKKQNNKGLIGSIDTGILLRGLEGKVDDHDYIFYDYNEDKNIDNPDYQPNLSRALKRRKKPPLIIKVMKTKDIAKSISQLKPGAKILVNSKQSAKLPRVVKDGIYRIEVPSYKGNDKIVNVTPKKAMYVERSNILPPDINGAIVNKKPSNQNLYGMQDDLNKLTIFGTAVITESLIKTDKSSVNVDLPTDYINNWGRTAPSNLAQPYYNYEQEVGNRPNPMPPYQGNFPQNYPPRQFNNINNNYNSFTPQNVSYPAPGETYFPMYGDATRSYDGNVNKIGSYPNPPNYQNFPPPNSFQLPNNMYNNQPQYNAPQYGNTNDYNMGFNPNENQNQQPNIGNLPYNAPQQPYNNVPLDYMNSYNSGQPNSFQPKNMNPQQNYAPPQFDPKNNNPNVYQQYNPQESFNKNNFNPNFNPYPPPEQMSGKFGQMSPPQKNDFNRNYDERILRDNVPSSTTTEPTIIPELTTSPETITTKPTSNSVSSNTNHTIPFKQYDIHHHPHEQRSTVNLLTATTLSVTEKLTTPKATTPHAAHDHAFNEFPELSPRTTIDWKTTRILMELTHTNTTHIPTTTLPKVVYIGGPMENMPGGVGVENFGDEVVETSTLSPEDQLQENLEILATTIKGPPHTDPYTKIPSSEPPPVHVSSQVKEMLKDMETLKMGYFSIFLIRIFYSVARKKDFAVSRLAQGFEPHYQNLARDAYFVAIGDPFFTTYGEFCSLINGADPGYLKAASTSLHYAMVNRKSSLTMDYNSIIDYMDTLYTLGEGINLLEAAQMVEKYPEGDPTYLDVHKRVTDAVMEPIRRLINSIKTQILFDSINKVVESHMNARPPLARRSINNGRKIIKYKNKPLIKLKDKTIEFDSDIYIKPSSHKRMIQTKNINFESTMIKKLMRSGPPLSTRDNTNDHKYLKILKNTRRFPERNRKWRTNKADSQLKYTKTKPTRPDPFPNRASSESFITKGVPTTIQIGTSSRFQTNKFKQKTPIIQLNPLKNIKAGYNQDRDYIESDAFEFNDEFITTANIIDLNKFDTNDALPSMIYEVSREKIDNNNLEEIKKKIDAMEARYGEVLGTTSSVVRRYSIKRNTIKIMRDRTETTPINNMDSNEINTVIHSIKPTMTTAQANMGQEVIDNILEIINTNNAIKQKEDEGIPKEPGPSSTLNMDHKKKKKKKKHKIKKKHHKHKKLRLNKRTIRHLRLKHPKLFKRFIKKRKRHSKNKKNKKHKNKTDLSRKKFKKVNQLIKKYNKVGNNYEKLLKTYMLRKKNSGDDHIEDSKDDVSRNSLEYHDYQKQDYVKNNYHTQNFQKPDFQINDFQQQDNQKHEFQKQDFRKPKYPKTRYQKHDYQQDDYAESEFRIQRDMYGFYSIEQTSKRTITTKTQKFRPAYKTRKITRTPHHKTISPKIWSHIPLEVTGAKKRAQYFNHSSHPKFKSERGILKKFHNFLDNRKNALKERIETIRQSSSYSDEEINLKLHLFDAMKHNKEFFRGARRLNREDDVKTQVYNKLNKFSSYSSEEVVIKSNLYKAIVSNNTAGLKLRSDGKDKSIWRFPPAKRFNKMS